jgi:hypothetical protein
MAPKQVQQWTVGDIFTVKLLDGTFAVGQVVDVPMANTASCALFGRRFDHQPKERFAFALDDVVGVATVVPAHLDRGVWKVFSRGRVVLPQSQWPNEATRLRRWVGSKVYTGAILEDFLNAYHALAPWNKFHDPEYLDKILIDPSKKPAKLIYRDKIRGRES